MFRAKIIGVMACAKNGVIGSNDAIPWHYPDEIQHFRDIIGNFPIILGRKSFELIPKSILKNRTSIVFSKTRKQNTSDVIFVSSLDDFFALGVVEKMDKIFLVGGAQLANYFLKNNLIFEFILTKFKRSYVGDSILNIKAFDCWKSDIINKMSDYDVYKLTMK